jgi:Icc-related predicted phosphoesterase
MYQGMVVNLNVGCELLRVKSDELRPKIFVGGHIHSGAGYKFDGHTHYFQCFGFEMNRYTVT